MPTPTFWETIQPHLDRALSALGEHFEIAIGTIAPLVVGWFVRNYFQHRDARRFVLETEDEAPHLGLKRELKLRHTKAKQKTHSSIFTRPLTESGGEKLIESEWKKVDAEQKSVRPGPR